MNMKRFRKNEDGAVAVIAAVMMVALLGFAALTVDMGATYIKSSKIQSTCDSASLAAAAYLPDISVAEQQAKYYIDKNGLDSSKAIITFANSNSEIKVEYKDAYDTSFAKVLGINSQTVKKSATAGVEIIPRGKKPLNGFFDYLLFQYKDDPNDPMDITSHAEIYGKIHSNSYIEINACTALGGVSECIPSFNQKGSAFWLCDTEGNKLGSVTKEWYPNVKSYVSTNTTSLYAPAENKTYLDETPYYKNEAEKVEYPSFIMENVEALIPDSCPKPVSSSGYSSSPIMASGGVRLTVNNDLYFNSNAEISSYGSGGAGGYNSVVVNGNVYVQGNLTINGDVTINGNIYCTGTINSSGGGFKIRGDYTYCDKFLPNNGCTVSGALIAESSIKLDGNGNVLDGSIALVCKNGDIALTSGGQDINGILYAPNGEVKFGGTSRVYGNLIAQKVDTYSKLIIYPMKDSTVEDLEDIVIDKNPSGGDSGTPGGVKLLK